MPGLSALLVAVGATSAVSCSAHDPNLVDNSDQTGEFEQALGAAVTVSFQDGVSPTTAYAGTADASIKQANATTNFGAATTLEADGDDGSGVDKSSLTKWTLSGIPAGAIVQSASITGTLEMLHALAKSYVLHMRPASVEVVPLDAGRAVVRLAEIYNFLDSHNVGVFEGLFRHARVTGRVRIASYSPTEADFLCEWQ